MTSRKLLAIPAFAVALALSLAGCGSGPTDPTNPGGTAKSELVLGILQEPASWDPAQAHVGHRLQPFQAAYDTLILRQPDGSYAPMLATKWGYTDDKGMTFSLDLRTDVTFSDGEKFNAAAVVANIEHFKADNGPQAAQAAAVASAKAIDDDTVDVALQTAISHAEAKLLAIGPAGTQVETGVAQPRDHAVLHDVAALEDA